MDWSVPPARRFCDKCGSPNEIVVMITVAGYDPRTGERIEDRKRTIGCTNKACARFAKAVGAGSFVQRRVGKS